MTMNLANLVEAVAAVVPEPRRGDLGGSRGDVRRARRPRANRYSSYRCTERELLHSLDYADLVAP